MLLKVSFIVIRSKIWQQLKNVALIQKNQSTKMLFAETFVKLKMIYFHLFFLNTVDQIYHLASPASPPNYMYNPIKTLKTNTIGTLNMLGEYMSALMD